MRLPKTWENRQYGTECSALITHADILPTLVTAAGGVPPENCDGRDLIALARGRKRRRTLCYCRHRARSIESLNYLAITDGNWKYIYYPEGACRAIFRFTTGSTRIN